MRTFNYNLGDTLELQSEDLPAFFGVRRLTYEYDLTGTKGRLATMQAIRRFLAAVLRSPIK